MFHGGHVGVLQCTCTVLNGRKALPPSLWSTAGSYLFHRWRKQASPNLTFSDILTGCNLNMACKLFSMESFEELASHVKFEKIFIGIVQLFLIKSKTVVMYGTKGG